MRSPKYGEKGYIFSEPLEEVQFNEARSRFFKFKDVGSHIMRIAEFANAQEAKMGAAAAQDELNDLSSQYGIAYAQHQNILGPGEGGDVRLYQYTEYIEDGVGFGNLEKIGVIGDEVAYEIDRTTDGLARHIGDVAVHGGILNPEYMRLAQFVISPSKPQGERMILVDVEPMSPQVVAKPELRRESGEDIMPIVTSTAVLLRDFLSVKPYTDYDFSAVESMRQTINMIHGGDSVFERVRNDLLQALNTGDTSIVDRLLELYEDEEETPDAYWEQYVGTHRAVYADTFASLDHIYQYTGDA